MKGFFFTTSNYLVCDKGGIRIAFFRSSKLYFLLSVIILVCLSSFDEPESPSFSPRIVTADTLHVRTGPGLAFSISATLKQNDRVSVIDQQGNWLFVQFQDLEGWISKPHTALLDFNNLSPQQQIELKSTPVIQNAPTDYLKGKTIILDPGHGGKDKGAIGTQGTYEKDLTLRTARFVQEELQNDGATVKLTRTDDSYVELSNRILASNSADLYISIHYNSVANPDLTGLITYFYHDNQDSILAGSIHASLVHHSDLKDKGVRFGDYYVLRENKRPSILLELGFLSNKREETYINSVGYQRRVAHQVAVGIQQYFKQQ
ncbi:N-acetylmuramoyl-L-alanine amidase [Priestia flexa]|uniref:N-acetylmuramoyl-L-alanine amidase n=1 Tax=Priestia flexa TaxID=86664 RepID=UPI00099D8AEC|nr:N-acetylmuramoyl-L-alanine amidase [Priestia flexa]